MTRAPRPSSPGQVPPEVSARAKAVFSHRGRGELAVLVGDTLVDEDAPQKVYTDWFRV